MSTKCLLLAAALLCGVPATVRAAQPAAAGAAKTDLPVLLQTIRANRKALVAVNLNLSPEEGAAFWPLYDRYQGELNVIGDRLAALIEEYTTHFGDLSNDRAMQLMQDYLAGEAERLAVRRTYLDQFAKVLPGRTVARFYQIENKMDAVIRYDLAATIPVVQQEPGNAAK